MTLLTNLSAYYKLDGNSNDVLGNYNGTDTSITYNSGNGIIIQGAGVNGTSSGIKLADNAVLKPTSGDYSISAWVKPSSVTGTRQIYGGTDTAIIHIAGGKFQFFTEDASRSNFSINSTTSPSNGNWYHVVAVMKAGTSMKIYVNGTLEGTNSTSIPSTYFANTGAVAAIGLSDNSPDASFFAGAIDEVGFWGRELTAGEVTSLYNAGAGLQYPFGLGFTPSPMMHMMGVAGGLM